MLLYKEGTRMPLSYRFKDIQDHETICWDSSGHLSLVTHSIILQTMIIELGSITEGSAAEFWARLDMAQKLGTTMATKADGSDLLVTAEDVVAHIGLWTNVADKNRASWLSHFAKYRLDESKLVVAKLLATPVSA